MALRLAKLLLLTLIQGEIIAIFSFPNSEDGNSAVISNAEDLYEKIPDDNPDPVEAVLPSQGKVKNRRSIQKRSTGRAVNIPADVVERMAQVPTAALSTDLPDIQKAILDTHNKLRRLASPNASNMLKMIWSPEAAKTAQDWAKKCQPGHSLPTQRKITNLKCGENTFFSAFRVDWPTVIDSWYSEGPDFKYGFGARSADLEIGHYTQLMWASSFAIGCAMTECATGPIKFNFVCHYGPSGNRGGRKFPWREGKPCEECPNSCENDLCTNPCHFEDLYGNCNTFSSNCVSDPSLKEKCPGTCMCTKGEIK